MRILPVHAVQVHIIKWLGRNPLIIEQKLEYVRANKELLKELLVTDYALLRQIHKVHYPDCMRGKFPDTRLFSPRTIEEGERIKKIFGYCERSPAIQVMFHFRKLYRKLYPEEFQ